MIIHVLLSFFFLFEYTALHIYTYYSHVFTYVHTEFALQVSVIDLLYFILILHFYHRQYDVCTWLYLPSRIQKTYIFTHTG